MLRSQELYLRFLLLIINRNLLPGTHCVVYIITRHNRGGTVEPVSRDEILRRERGQGNIHFPCSADHEQDWQSYPFDPYSAI